MSKTAVLKDPLFLEHKPGEDHVESPQRLAGVFNRLAEPHNQKRFIFPEFAAASPEVIALNHCYEHIERLAATAGRESVALDPDTRSSPFSYQAACLAAGAVVKGVEMLAGKECDNGFAIVRPPGHHAEHDHTRGFCFFNNIAIGAHYALKRLGMERVLVIDWDLHHGNGTQNAFYDSEQVLFFSTHQYPFFPGSGAINQFGRGKGEGYTINVPLPGGQDDLAYARIFNTLLSSLAREYRPELILVSAGFDIYAGDPLGTMMVSDLGFSYLTKVVKELAEELCDGRLLLVLEGGYDLGIMERGTMACLNELAGDMAKSEDELLRLRWSDSKVNSLEHASSLAKNYWQNL